MSLHPMEELSIGLALVKIADHALPEATKLVEQIEAGTPVTIGQLAKEVLIPALQATERSEFGKTVILHGRKG